MGHCLDPMSHIKGDFMKRFIFITVLFVLMTGCQGGFNGSAEDIGIEEKAAWLKDFDNESIGIKNEEKNVHVSGDPEVSLGGIVLITDDAIIVEGESNLLEGTVVQATRYRHPFTIRHPICVACGSEHTSVNEDGSFYFELPLPDESFEQSYIELALEVKMPYLQFEEVTALYGDRGERMEGPFIHPYNHSGETRYKAYAPIYIFVDGEQKEYKIEAMDLDKPPSDYGEADVWVGADVTNDHRYIYVDGKSNLLAGTNVKAVYYASETATLPQHWFSSEDLVKKDGSFLLRIPYDSITEEGFIKFSLWPEYSHEAPVEIAETYGEDFVHIQGEQVIENEDGKKGIEFELDPLFPELEFNLPQEAMITTDGDETKIQLPDYILFDYGDHSLKEEAEMVLDNLLESFTEFDKGTVIEINGHTDNSGGDDFNQKLSEERAESVANYFFQSDHVNHLIINAAGYGRSMPLASNDDQLGRQKNRRLEFVINPN